MTGQTVSGAVAKRDDVTNLNATIAGYTEDYAKVLPQHIDAQHWVRLAQGLLRRNEDLAAVAVRNPGSLLSALLDCARLGHEPGTDQYALVVFGNEIQGIEQYQGEIERMYRAGAVQSVICEVVRANDMFRYSPGRPPEHDADWFAKPEDRGELVGVYAFAVLQGGAVSKTVVMGAAEVAKHKAVARTKVMWDKWEEAMWRKTAIHELEKWVPTSSEYRREQLRAMAEAQNFTRHTVEQITTTEDES